MDMIYIYSENDDIHIQCSWGTKTINNKNIYNQCVKLHFHDSVDVSVIIKKAVPGWKIYKMYMYIQVHSIFLFPVWSFAGRQSFSYQGEDYSTVLLPDMKWSEDHV